MPYKGKPLVGGYRPHPEPVITKKARPNMPMAKPEDGGKRPYTGSPRDLNPKMPGADTVIVKTKY
jgi:hypothetical protein